MEFSRRQLFAMMAALPFARRFPQVVQLDTVPTMLSPGEIILSRDQARRMMTMTTISWDAVPGATHYQLHQNGARVRAFGPPRNK